MASLMMKKPGDEEDSDDEVSDEIINDDLSRASGEDIAPLPNNVDGNDVADDVDDNNLTDYQALPEENIVDVNAYLIHGNEQILEIHEPADEHMEISGVGNEQDNDGPGVGDKQDGDVTQQGDGTHDLGINPLEATVADPRTTMIQWRTTMIQLSLFIIYV